MFLQYSASLGSFMEQRRTVIGILFYSGFFRHFFPNKNTYQSFCLLGEGKESSLVVCMELNGQTYQGILFQKPI